MRALRPAFAEPVLAYAIASALIWGVAAVAIFMLPFPSAYVGPLLEIFALPAAAFFVAKSAQTLWLNLTERYFIGAETVQMERGWFHRHTQTVPMRSVAWSGVEVSLLHRILGVGTVVIHTNDHADFWLYDLKEAMQVRERIDPIFASEPVFRPSVG
jgi:membrane protein YdbS with pleckstrin-like domain